MSGTVGMNAQQLAQARYNQNINARNLIIGNAVDMLQPVFSSTFVPSAGNNVVNIQPRYVGLIKGFYVKVTATIANTSGSAFALTDFNVANILSNITLTDLNNNVRINTTGWHLTFVNTIKARSIYGDAAVYSTGFDSPIKYGNNYNPGVINAAATLATGNNTTINMYYWVPCAYSDDDYRGAIYANVLNATMQLTLTVNPNPIAATTTDATNAVYLSAGTAAGSITSCTIAVSQSYMDQIPMANGLPILPAMDLQTIYELKYTQFTAINAGNDFPVQYPNFRDFLGTVAVYNNNGTTGRAAGTDINYWSLLAANVTPIFKVDPYLQALRTRNMLNVDMPLGVYYFSSRRKPIATSQYGNMQLVLNPITAAAGAYLTIGWEDFSMINTIGSAGSLPSS